ncbi:threonine-phosphate decarboxylase CobD [Denitromonas iodatirespirans]|uniref:threonine-phosphate decarboxylase n=1 Tax=Denitromonas iodatirespirans TaxID=2795389 RepID=A0A944HAX7_DENI1|nr:threonine-phosphate decarboxylase CobD [Denitromonas iodatirespirans]MBT0961072.1 threonine-phosphate decarboxylase [Denitromonas iodatirespirans]
MLEHGGGLRAAAAQYGMAPAHWLDLSTGINPVHYPVTAPPAGAWHRLPEPDASLLAAAASYYGSDQLLPVAGSQAAIQALPAVLPARRIGLLAPSYAEHAHAWRGREVVDLDAEAIDATIDTLDALLLVHPNNPTGQRVARAQLSDWLGRLQARGATLILDEAFIDTDPADSLAPLAGQAGLVILRSLGKFFGLAGARVGFVLAPADLRRALAEQLGPWTLSGPAQDIARQALSDTPWQLSARRQLAEAGARMGALLTRHGARPHGPALFKYVPTASARRWQDALAQHAIWVRAFDTPAALRFGLPADETGWTRLDTALHHARSTGLTLE